MPFRSRPVVDHNGAQWLDVEFRDQRYNGQPRKKRYGRGKGKEPAREPIPPGWYVVRCCPCHDGEAVTIPLSTREHAERVLVLLIHVGIA